MKKSLILFFFLTSLSVYSQESAERKSNKKTVVVKEYFENGQLKEKGRKKLQMKISSTPNGRSNGLMTYFKKGKWIEYYSNGNKKRIIVYDKGEIVKEVKSWNEDGTKSKAKHNK